jgi:hypothetical protein
MTQYYLDMTSDALFIICCILGLLFLIRAMGYLKKIYLFTQDVREGKVKIKLITLHPSTKNLLPPPKKEA